MTSNKFFSNIKILLLPILLLSFSCGGGMSDISRPGDSDDFDHYLNTTVAFVGFREDGRMYGPTCTGFFISPRKLGTALHCVETKDYELVELIPGLVIRRPVAAKPTVGSKAFFISVATEEDWLSGKTGAAPPKFFTAIVKKIDKENDVAILELAPEEDNWSDWLEIRDLEDEPLEVGEKAFSISNPFGHTFILSEGRISRIKVNATSIRIQHQVRLGPGSSGSALLDEEGRAIGITSTGSEWGVVVTSIPISYLSTQLKILKTDKKIKRMDDKAGY